MTRIASFCVGLLLLGAATAHAAEWAGLTPLICDVDPGDWSAAEAAEAAAFARYGDRIAVVVPYATFGASIGITTGSVCTTLY